MDVMKILSVGRSGVGKSTIGNCLVEGNPKGKSFATSSSSQSCTKEAKWVTGSNCSYCDLPAIPDASADKTREYYDIVIKEARKEINIILFVFKYEMINFDDFSKAKMLFRELKKSNAIKVLLINDMNDSSIAAEPEHAGMEKLIKDCTGLSFSHIMSMNSKTMVSCLTNLKELIYKKVPHASPSLKTYVELKAYVEESNKKQNYEQIAQEEEMAKISQIEMELNELGADASIPYGIEVSLYNNTAVWLPFCGPSTIYVSDPSSMEAASKTLEVEVKKMELELAKRRTKYEIKETGKVFQDACQSFKELDDILSQ